MYSFSRKISHFTLCAVLCTATLNAAPQTNATKSAAAPIKKPEAFKAFSGKVVANKVRMRVKPDLDSHIIRQVSKNDLLLIVGEEGSFYAVQPPKDTKAYVFRSYILDDRVEANRVNVRIEPNPDGAIIGQFQQGDLVKGQVCAVNHKWLEITPPSSTRFYVSKEFIDKVGGPEYIANMERRKAQVEEMLTTAYFAAESECKKNYEDMQVQGLIEQFQTVIRQYPEFPEAVHQAKEGLALLKETYLNKKISYLEEKAELSPSAKQELLMRHKEENSELLNNATAKVNPDLFAKRIAHLDMTDQMRFWDTVEESLYLSWSAFHTGRKMDDFYAEQKVNATVLTGKITVYDHPIKNKPGNFLLRGIDAPLAYLYSTCVDLQKYEGKQVSVLVSPRANNHFAFPAYYVLGVE